jgi:predicted RNA-binding Zn ribbon-like protein
VVLPEWVPQIETKPAPGELLLLQAFINTYEADTSVDVLSEPASANEWLHKSQLVPVGIDISGESLDRLRAVRESLRLLLDHNAGRGDPSLAALEVISEAANGSGIELTVIPEEGYRVMAQPGGADPVGIAVLRLMLIVRDAQLSGTWDRLKTCSNLDCRWAFYDRSHSHVGRWCDMATCGNRIKNRALRARRP